MAEEKKDAPKPTSDHSEETKSKSVPFGQFTAETIGVIIAALIVLGFINKYIVNGSFSGQSLIDAIMSSLFGLYLQRTVIVFIIVSTLLSFLFLILLIYSLVKFREAQKKWYKAVNPDFEEVQTIEIKNDRWQRIVEHMSSDNPANWRLAILEADIILDELLDSLGYIGDTIGDKLKKVNRGDFKSLDDAWEAHRIRNAIAHEGQDFVLTRREAQRILGLYETSFREFDFI